VVRRTARLLALSLLALSCAWAARALQRDLATPRDLHGAQHGGASECTRCHPDHAASFGRTFHRTMTQLASERSVLGRFDDQPIDYFGVRARASRGPRGEFVIEYAGPQLPATRFVVEKTVGSRRYQQYIAARDGELVRLPIAYHIEEQRWFHMNGAFLTPDPQPEPALARHDYERHVTRWNDNCVFCHNVAPNPGKRAGTGRARFDTQVAELGVACEACHGPGLQHARANANPLRRYALQLSGACDPSIVNPARLAPERALDVCGRCHGQRITDDIEAFLRRGDPFVPGDDLALFSAPLWHDTTLHGEAAFAARFWPDGTPRLTAYEYQGVLQSPCAQRGALTCLSCHGMHEGDPRGQLRPDKLGAAQCTQCHAELAVSGAQRAHARHPEPSALPSCVDCHMPSVVYGVLDVHPSHRIELPDPARDAAAQRPDACTLCHVDQTRAWASRQRDVLWPRLDATRGVHGAGAPPRSDAARGLHGAAAPPRSDATRGVHGAAAPPRSDAARGLHGAAAPPRSDATRGVHGAGAPPRSDAARGLHGAAAPPRSDAARGLHGAGASLPEASAWSEAETQLFAGDPVERALAAHALGRRAPPRSDERHTALLLEVMQYDPYPAVRHLALRSLRARFGEHARANANVHVNEPEQPRRAAAGSARSAARLHPRIPPRRPRQRPGCRARPLQPRRARRGARARAASARADAGHRHRRVKCRHSIKNSCARVASASPP
jgi:hypothetical protein